MGVIELVGCQAEETIMPTYHDFVVQTITQRVDDGTYPRGSRLPPARELADELGVSVSTLRNAYRVLADRGVINGQPGKATYAGRVDERTDGPRFTPAEDGPPEV